MPCLDAGDSARPESASMDQSTQAATVHLAVVSTGGRALSRQASSNAAINAPLAVVSNGPDAMRTSEI